MQLSTWHDGDEVVQIIDEAIQASFGLNVGSRGVFSLPVVKGKHLISFSLGLLDDFSLRWIVLCMYT